MITFEEKWAEALGRFGDATYDSQATKAYLGRHEMRQLNEIIYPNTGRPTYKGCLVFVVDDESHIEFSP